MTRLDRSLSQQDEGTEGWLFSRHPSLACRQPGAAGPGSAAGREACVGVRACVWTREGEPEAPAGGGNRSPRSGARTLNAPSPSPLLAPW